MQIKRDYSQPFFGTRRRRRSSARFMLVYVALLGAFLLFVYTQFDRLQLAALDVVGLAPTATPFASDLATQGALLFQQGDVAAAVALFEQAAAQQPTNIDYLYELGKMYIELDRAEDAVTVADQAIQINPQDARGYALKTRALAWSGDAASAIPVGVAGLELNSSFAPLYAALARAYTAIGRYQQGVEYGERAIELDPMDVEAHRSYAYTLIWVGQRELAIQQLEDAVALNPNLTNSYFELALQYLSTGQEEMAIATYERILSLEPRNERAYLRLCQAYSRVGQQDRAQGYCEDALDLNPDYAAAWAEVGMARYTRRNYEGAIEAFETCISNGSTDIRCWYLRGLAHYYLGDCDDAWAILEEALPMAEALADGANIVDDVREGLRLTTISCPSYAGRALPTVPAPTAIPPTPIGG
jgi:tetratricopeptide (TPR) repeat protein